jgi:hypothetical protein
MRGTRAAHIRQHVRQHQLQVAHGAFFRIVAARIGVQSGAPFRRHADEMRALVQHRVQRRIEAREIFAPIKPASRSPQ